MTHNHHLRARIAGLLMPAVVFGSISGVATAAIVMLYKLCATKIIHFTEHAYATMRQTPLYLLAAVVTIAVTALLYRLALDRYPDVKGGGIPTSIALLRGIISCRWLVNIVYVFIMSLLSFALGLPLGNEGPSVQMGTATGKGVVETLAPKHKAYSRYAMTGGACAGFSIATGAPISGMLFAVEEAHHRISPLIILVSAIAVLFANITSSILAPLLGVSTSLFSLDTPLRILTVRDYWLPLAVGVILGLFAVLFLHAYEWIRHFTNTQMARLPFYVRILAILAATLALGLVSFDFISTGHELTLHLFPMDKPILLLLVILLVRITLTLLANTNGITGGIFLPILSLGALVAAIFGTLCVKHLGLSPDYYTVILVLGICGCISGMMKMPLTAIFFGIEALGCADNIVPVMLVAVLAYAMTELFGVESINDSVIAARVKAMEGDSDPEVVDTHVTVGEGAFAVGRQIRDILWPNNLFVLSVRRAEEARSTVDEHGENHIHPGDILHVRYATHDCEATAEELHAIVE